jgi:hypothetical protein
MVEQSLFVRVTRYKFQTQKKRGEPVDSPRYTLRAFARATQSRR